MSAFRGARSRPFIYKRLGEVDDVGVRLVGGGGGSEEAVHGREGAEKR